MRRCSKTEAMFALRDHPALWLPITFTPTTINYIQKDTTMRLSAKAKTENELAATLAHVKRLQLDNGIYQHTSAEKDAAGKRLAALLEDRDSTIKTQAQHIAAFKQEVLALTTENATLRGYMARVLEDDTVREVGGAKQPEAAMADDERSHLQQVLAADHHARRQPPRSVRTGPIHVLFAPDAQWDGHVQGARPAPKPWLQR